MYSSLHKSSQRHTVGSLSALQTKRLCRYFPYLLPSPFLPPLPFGILALALALVLPAVLREVTKSSARVALLVTVLLQRVHLHRCCARVIGSTTHLVRSRPCCPCTRNIHKLSTKKGPRLESLRIQKQVRRELCVRHSVQNNPHTQAI